MTETSKTSTTVPIKVEFTGGLEALFAHQRSHNIDLPNPSSGQQPTVSYLVQWLTDTYLSDSPKKELFVLDGQVRPGILVLINDADWELEGEGSYRLEPKDEIVFVSTLHGG